MVKEKLSYSTEFRIVQDSVHQLNPEFSLCDVLVAYHGDNRNKSSISKKVFEDNLYSIYGIPIVGEWVRKLDDQNVETWGSHGSRLILDDSGIKYEQTTKPFGFVTLEAKDNASWVTIKEKGHIDKEYLKLEKCILWNDRYEECQSILEKNYGQSMELSRIDGDFRDDGYLEITKMNFSALCILGDDHEPCFESANVSKHYELDEFKQECQKMLIAYKSFNLETQSNLNKKNNKEVISTMEIKPTILSAIASSLADIQFRSNANAMYEKYILYSINDVSITLIDREDLYKAFSVPYLVTETAENVAVAIDFEKKMDKDIIVSDKSENTGTFNIQSEIDTISGNRTAFELQNHENTIIKDLQDKLSAQESSYSKLQDESEKCKQQISIFTKEKDEVKKQNHKNSIDAIVSTYANIMGKYADFLAYRATLDYTKNIETIETDLKIIHSDFSLESGKKLNFSANFVESGIVGNRSLSDNPMSDRYGDLLEKY